MKDISYRDICMIGLVYRLTVQMHDEARFCLSHDSHFAIEGDVLTAYCTADFHRALSFAQQMGTIAR